MVKVELLCRLLVAANIQTIILFKNRNCMLPILLIMIVFFKERTYDHFHPTWVRKCLVFSNTLFRNIYIFCRRNIIMTSILSPPCPKNKESSKYFIVWLLIDQHMPSYNNQTVSLYDCTSLFIYTNKLFSQNSIHAFIWISDCFV